jgi:hypothetical protein
MLLNAGHLLPKKDTVPFFPYTGWVSYLTLHIGTGFDNNKVLGLTIHSYFGL